MNLFDRAGANLALSAFERALLRFLKSLWLTVLLATLPVFSSLITALDTNALSVDWRSYGYRLLAAVGTSLALAIQKYFSAQGDGTPNLNAPVTLQSAVLSASAPLPPPPATTAPASPSYVAQAASQVPMPAISGGMTIAPQFPPSVVTSSPSAPQPSPDDTPTVVVPKTSDTTATAQVAADAT